jgi:formyltetrahydrofolate-dependent phosphoribosylglycinamide formyltransferase
VVLVASDHADAGALARARDAGITAQALDRTARTSGLAAILASHRVEMVVLAGYLRLVPADVVSHFRGQILNVHPALLPAFSGPGMFGHHVHEAVIRRGLRLTGPTVHFVDERYDEGPIIAQWPVAVLPTDTPDELARRVLEVEHVLYPRVVEAVAAGRIRLGDNNRVLLDTKADAVTLPSGMFRREPYLETLSRTPAMIRLPLRLPFASALLCPLNAHCTPLGL